MLVQINTQVGGVSTDQKTRWFNFMSSLHAVATAAAGSTPVVNPVNTSAVKNTSYNCITVLSNAEAGGWSTGAANNITASTTYNGSGGSYNIDLYNLTGKTTYPYYRIGFFQPYPFSGGNFTSYPFTYSYCGHSNTDPTGATPPWSDTILTTQSTGGGCNPNVYPTGSNFTSYSEVAFPRVDKDFAQYTSNPQNQQPIYVASTSGYLIIMTPFDIWYFGTRTVSPWELSRTDNPPWVSFGWSFNGNASPGYYTLSSYSLGNHYQAWASLISSDGSVTSAPRKLGYGSIGNTGTSYGHHFTGMNNASTVTMQANATVCSGLAPATHPLLNVNGNIGTNINPSVPARWDNMITDVTTGQQVPPAYPLIVNGSADVSTGNPATTYQTVQGVIKGILRGPSQSPAGLNAMLTASDYTIGSSTYVPVRIGSGGASPYDCFFIRKA